MYWKKIKNAAQPPFERSEFKTPETHDFRKTPSRERGVPRNISPVRAKRSDPAETLGDAVFRISVIS